MILQLQDLACGSVWQDCGHDQGAEVTGGSEDRNIPNQLNLEMTVLSAAYQLLSICKNS